MFSCADRGMEGGDDGLGGSLKSGEKRVDGRIDNFTVFGGKGGGVGGSVSGRGVAGWVGLA
jgi:hypothetical protein